MDAAEATNTERFKETIVKEWTDPATVAAWRGWHPKFALQSTEATEAIVHSEGRARWARPGPPDEVWERLEDVAVPFHEVIYGLEAEERERARGGKATK